MQSANAPGDPFEILAPPEQLLPIVFNSPHSGCCYPADFLALTRLDERAIRRSEDSYRRRTVRALPSPSARRCCAPISRAPIST